MKQDNLFDELLDDDGAQVPINDEFSDLEQPLNVETVDDNEDDDENNKKEPDEEKDDITKETTEEGYKFEESESINRILESKGINPHEILYEDENGEEIKVDFYNLDPEEQLNLLHYNPSSYDLEDNEVKAIKAFNTRTSPREVDGVMRYPAEDEVVPEVQCLIYFVLNISKALEGKE